MSRKERFKEFLNIVSEKYDAAFITPGPNLYYLTGLDPKSVMERLFVLIVTSDKKSVLISPNLYEDEADIDLLDEIVFWDDTQKPFEIFNEYLENIPNKRGKLLVEDHMDASILMKIQEFIKDFDQVPLSSETTPMRLTKSEEEIKYLRKAAEIVDDVFVELVGKKFEGKTEKEILAIIEHLIKKKGADDVAFDISVAAGENGPKGHHSPSEKIIRRGELVIMDFGARYKGYISDITRTVAVKECSKKAREVYEVVKKANEEAFKAVEVGTPIKKIDLTARKIIKDAGYGEYFTHRVGHGIGLETHEEPYMTSKNEDILQKGMTFTIEPGIYLKDEFGIRIEDDIVVREQGEKLTSANRDLTIVD